MSAFDDKWVHLGGDEAYQLGECPECAERAASIGKEGLYAEFFGRLCRHVIEQGRRPCLWGDMLAKFPDALEAIPRETVIFDWNYDLPPVATAKMFRERGFEVVYCPGIRSYGRGLVFSGSDPKGHRRPCRGRGANRRGRRLRLLLGIFRVFLFRFRSSSDHGGGTQSFGRGGLGGLAGERGRRGLHRGGGDSGKPDSRDVPLFVAGNHALASRAVGAPL